MGINLKQLAAELKLSTSTVSRALHDSHEISTETKQRVREMAEKLSYQPNPYASSLRKQKSKTIALVIPEIDNNFFTLAINGIEEIAQKKNYHVLIYLTHEDINKEIAIAKHLLSGRVDGILISVTSQTEEIEHLTTLYSTGIPIVFFDRICDQIDTAKITTDDYDSGYKATHHLIEAGCRNIAYLQVSETLSISKKRFAGFKEALHKENIPLQTDLVLTCADSNESNYEQIKNLLLSKNRPDGIFASVEKLAITTYEFCNELGIKIPDQVKVISFSNLATAPLLNPSLSTITQPAFDIGKKAAEVMFNIIEHRAVEEAKETTILKSSLISRDSTQ
jgi:LacI family transcriptional regulator